MWQQIKKHPFIIAGIIVVVFALTAFAIAVIQFGWDWTGFTGGESKITTTMITPGTTTATPGTTVATELQPAKALWDWLGLLGILAIPVVVALGATAITAHHTKTQEKAATLQEYKDALQTFWENMSKLILDNNLLKSHEGDPVREIARTQTLVTLSRLGGSQGHKAALLQFLHEANLIKNPNPIISLSPTLRRERIQSVSKVIVAHWDKALLNEADLHDTYLRQVDLTDADLSNADLSGADLQFTNLSKANLRGTDLTGTDLTGTDLTGATGITVEQLESQAKSLQGATMPDGSIHP
jgi:hypothetical protein